MCVVSLLSLILISRGLHMRNLFFGLELSWADLALLFFYMVPGFLLLVLPISCMISVFLTFLRMSTDRELIALKAGGISIYRMLVAPAFFSFICMCLALFISLYAISWGMNNFRSTVLHIANTRAKIVIQPGVFNRDLFGLTIFARKVDPASGKLQQVIFEDTTQDDKNSITVLASEGDIITDEARGELVFYLQDGRMYRVDGDNVSILDFDEYTVRLDLGHLVSRVSSAFTTIRPKEMSWKALLEIKKDQTSSSDKYNNKVQVEIHKRWALPAACLVLGLFALPLACAFEGLRRQMGMVLALALFMLYYSLLSIGLSTGESGVLPPFLGAWMANILFALAAVYGLHLTNREKVPSFGRMIARLRRKKKRPLSQEETEGRL